MAYCSTKNDKSSTVFNILALIFWQQKFKSNSLWSCSWINQNVQKLNFPLSFPQLVKKNDIVTILGNIDIIMSVATEINAVSYV